MNTKEIKLIARAIERALKTEGYPSTIVDAASERGERGLHGVLLHAISAAIGERNFHQASAKEAPTASPIPGKVWLAIYEHRHGEDRRVFATEELALEWRTQIAKNWWGHEFTDEDDKIPADENIGEVYFERIRDSDAAEYFDIEQVPVETESDLISLKTPIEE